MDFEKLLEDVQSLKSQFTVASQEQNGALGMLQNTLNQHYTELERQVEALQSIQVETLRLQAAEQNGKIGELQREQAAFVQEQGEKAERIRQSHGELSAAVASAEQKAKEVSEQFSVQEAKIAQIKLGAQADVRALASQSADAFGKVNTAMREMQSALSRLDQTKAVEELQKKLESLKEELQKKLETLKNETAASTGNLGGQLEKSRAQLEQLKEGQRSQGRLREDTDRLMQRADKLEDNVSSLRGKVRELASRESGLSGSERSGGSGNSSGFARGGRINWVALALGALAIVGLVVGGFFVQRAQNATKAQLQQQLTDLQATNAARLQELNDQIDQLTVIVEATPTPTPEPTPTPVPTATPTPAATTETGATTKPE